MSEFIEIPVEIESFSITVREPLPITVRTSDGTTIEATAEPCPGGFVVTARGGEVLGYVASDEVRVSIIENRSAETTAMARGRREHQ